MQQFGIKPNAPIYTAIIQCFAQEGNAESALSQLLTMKRTGIVPELAAAQSVISMVAVLGLARLAIELALWFENVSNRRMENYIWMECLHASAKHLYVCLVSLAARLQLTFCKARRRPQMLASGHRRTQPRPHRTDY